MFKKLSIGLFAVAASFGFVATSLPAYGQCTNCRGSSGTLTSFVSTKHDGQFARLLSLDCEVNASR